MTINLRTLLLASAVGVVAAGAGFTLSRWTIEAPPPAQTVATPEGPETLKLEGRAIEAAGIAVERVGSGNIGAEILAPAITTAQPGAVAVLTAHVDGVISRLHKRLGDPVWKGETLALVDSADAARASSDVESADARAVLARRIVAQERALFDEGATSRRSLDTAVASLAAAEADAKRARNAAVTANLTPDGHSVAVISPLSGRITAQSAALGAFVRTDTELFRVSDPRSVQVEAQVTARDAAHIKPGNGTILLLPNGTSAMATVHSVTPALDPQTRTQIVVISVPDGVALAPGETLQVRVMPDAAAANAIVVTEEAVQSLNGRDAVFQRTDSGFLVRHVVVGSRGGGRVAILSGLQPGQKIATRNAFLLKAELGKVGGEEE